jgi:hypothetical protein
VNQATLRGTFHGSILLTSMTASSSFARLGCSIRPRSRLIMLEPEALHTAEMVSAGI